MQKISRLKFKSPQNPMEEGLINRALKHLVFEKGKDLKEVQQYLLMKFNIEVDKQVLQKRMEKMSNQEKAVA